MWASKIMCLLPSLVDLSSFAGTYMVEVDSQERDCPLTATCALAHGQHQPTQLN